MSMRLTLPPFSPGEKVVGEADRMRDLPSAKGRAARDPLPLLP